MEAHQRRKTPCKIKKDDLSFSKKAHLSDFGSLGSTESRTIAPPLPKS
jgi:hypothetical protein